MSNALKRKNRIVLVSAFSIVFGMVGLSFAAVPLYDLFCSVTGYGGTTQVAQGQAKEILDRDVRVRFTARADRELPWAFSADQREMSLKIGDAGLAFYRVENTTDYPVAGMATYNVTPHEVGRYFVKMDCFCFEEQILQPGESMEMPVYFYVDPAIADNPNLDDVTTVTLSYTFFKAESDELDDAIDAYYHSVEQASLDAEAAGGTVATGR